MIKSMFDQIVKSLELPFWYQTFEGKLAMEPQPLRWFHLEDLCQLIKCSIENEKVSGILNGVAPDIITNGETSQRIS